MCRLLPASDDISTTPAQTNICTAGVQQQQQVVRLFPSLMTQSPCRSLYSQVCSCWWLLSWVYCDAAASFRSCLHPPKLPAVLQQGRQVLQQGQGSLNPSEAVQGLSQQTSDAAGRAAKATKQLASGLWQRGEQLASPGGLQGLKQDAAAVARRFRKVSEGVKLGSDVRYKQEEEQQQQQQLQQGQPGTAAEAAVRRVGRSEQEVDAILANS